VKEDRVSVRTVARCKCGVRISRNASRCRGCSAKRDAAWQELVIAINCSIRDGAVVERVTAFGTVRVASVGYPSTGMEYQTTGDWLSARTFVIDGGVLLEFARIAGVEVPALLR